MHLDQQQHWENIYQTKDSKEVSWFQSKPETSLSCIQENNLPKTAKIIDVGGGDSYLVDNLLDLGYQDITVLDISKTAIEQAKKRLGERAARVNWIVADILSFQPQEQYDLWHDRAAFHFLTEEKAIHEYVALAGQSIAQDGLLVIGTFSEQGPKKCSGIEIRQYSEKSLSERFELYFKKKNCITVDHQTPFHTIQNFTFCSFKKR